MYMWVKDDQIYLKIRLARYSNRPPIKLESFLDVRVCTYNVHT